MFNKFKLNIQQNVNNVSCKFNFFPAWLNNCVGYGNHRYFFLYMVYTAIGCLYIMIFGVEIAYKALWTGDGEGWSEIEPLVGHPVKFNLTGHIIAVVI